MEEEENGRETCLVNGEFLDPIVGVSRGGGKRARKMFQKLRRGKVNGWMRGWVEC